MIQAKGSNRSTERIYTLSQDATLLPHPWIDPTIPDNVTTTDADKGGSLLLIGFLSSRGVAESGILGEMNAT